MLKAGLTALGMQAGQLAKTAKSSREKQALAWWLRRRTTVGRHWVCERLCMGEVSAVNRSIRLVEVGCDPPLERMKRTLENLPDAKA